MNLIGLDFEASGPDPWGKHVPIQVGVVTDNLLRSYRIGRWNWNEYEWNEEAAQVHNIPREELASADPVWKVDILLASDLIRAGLGSRMWNITVGWNVAGYDRQFITRWFPNVNRLLSYRTIDLNALVFLRANGMESEYKRIKSLVKQYANDRLGVTEENGRHDALVDARAALLEYEALQKLQRMASGTMQILPDLVVSDTCGGSAKLQSDAISGRLDQGG